MKLKIKKRSMLQWSTLAVIGVLLVLRILVLMYFIQALFVFVAIYQALNNRIPKKQMIYVYSNICFIVVSVISIGWSSSISKSLSSIISIVQVMLISFLVFLTCNTKETFNDIISFFPKYAWMMLIYIFLATPVAEWKKMFQMNTNLSSSAGRLGPTIGMHTNMCGAVLSILIIVDIYMLLIYKNKNLLIQCILLFIALMLTKSRMSLLVVAVCVGLYYALYKRISTKQVIKTIGMLLVIAIILIFCLNNSFLYNLFGNRIESLLYIFKGVSNTDASVTGRLALQKRAMEVFFSHPFLGVGIGNFSSYSQNLGGVSGFYAHNNYLELLADIGLVGTTFYYVPYIIGLFRIKKIIKDANEQDRQFFCLLFVLLIMRLISDLSQVSYLFDSSQLLLALIFCAIKIYKSSMN